MPRPSKKTSAAPGPSEKTSAAPRPSKKRPGISLQASEPDITFTTSIWNTERGEGRVTCEVKLTEVIGYMAKYLQATNTELDKEVGGWDAWIRREELEARTNQTKEWVFALTEDKKAVAFAHCEPVAVYKPCGCKKGNKGKFLTGQCPHCKTRTELFRRFYYLSKVACLPTFSGKGLGKKLVQLTIDNLVQLETPKGKKRKCAQDEILLLLNFATGKDHLGKYYGSMGFHHASAEEAPLHVKICSDFITERAHPVAMYMTVHLNDSQ